MTTLEEIEKEFTNCHVPMERVFCHIPDLIAEIKKLRLQIIALEQLMPRNKTLPSGYVTADEQKEN